MYILIAYRNILLGVGDDNFQTNLKWRGYESPKSALISSTSNMSMKVKNYDDNS